MIVFPNCKINLGLRILDKRDDGYHNLLSVFYPVSWCDAVEIRKADLFSISVEGVEIPPSEDLNLCERAFRLLQKKYSIPPVEMILLKSIPVGAGLGGGSSDAAFTLKLLDQYFQLRLSANMLMELALELGSDCPFFIFNKPALISGRGEKMQPVEVNLSGYNLLLIHPGTEVNTSRAYQQLSENRKRQPSTGEGLSIADIVSQPVATWKDCLMNDFEEIIFTRFPEVANLKSMLYQAGALFASMSGSGSSVFGIFPEGMKINIKTPYRSYKGKL